jgi:hypothetical protein
VRIQESKRLAEVGAHKSVREDVQQHDEQTLAGIGNPSGIACASRHECQKKTEHRDAKVQG